MPELHVSAEREQRELADRYCTDFDETVLRDAVHDRIVADEQLGQLLDLHYRAESAEATRREAVGTDTNAKTIRDVSGRVRNLATQRAREIVAEACERVRENAVAWADDDVRVQTHEARRAVAEAQEWLSHNSNPAERAGVAISPDGGRDE